MYRLGFFQHRQKGAALVEFSLAVMLFFVVVIGVVEFGRTMFLLNLAGRATQMATRLATICSNDDPTRAMIREKVRFYVEGSGQIKVPTGTTWLTITPNSDTCYSASTDPCWITTSLNNLQFTLMIPLMNINITLPPYRVTQVREAMDSSNNPACVP